MSKKQEPLTREDEAFLDWISQVADQDPGRRPESGRAPRTPWVGDKARARPARGPVPALVVALVVAAVAGLAGVDIWSPTGFVVALVAAAAYGAFLFPAGADRPVTGGSGKRNS